MSDELNSQLSAFIDDELTPEESELFVRRLCREETLRHTAACYGIIGDVLRGESAVTAPNDFAVGVMMAVEGQTAPAVRARPVADRPSIRHWGFALAASVALAAIALMTLPSRGPEGLDTISADAGAGTGVPLSVVAASEPETRPAAFAAGGDERAPVIIATGEPIRTATANGFAVVPNGTDVPDYYRTSNYMPATAENRARLNNLLLQHLYTSGATRRPAGFRNVGFYTETEAQR